MKLFLFDLDGTLVLTGGAGVRALDELFEKCYGVSQATASLRPDGKTDPEIFREIFRRRLNRSPAASEMKKATRVYIQSLRGTLTKRSGYRVMRGIREFLRTIASRGDALALGTGNFRESARLKLMRSRLWRYFPVGGFGSDSEDRAEILKIAARRASRQYHRSFRRQDIFVVGDTPRDVLAARRAGFRSIAVATGNTPLKTLRKSKPDFFFEDLSRASEVFRMIQNG